MAGIIHIMSLFLSTSWKGKYRYEELAIMCNLRNFKK